MSQYIYAVHVPTKKKEHLSYTATGARNLACIFFM